MNMTSRERFHATIERRPVDRPASWLGIPAHAAVPQLLEYFAVTDLDALRLKLGDDVYPVELPYHSPFSDAIYMAFDFAKSGHLADEERTLNSPGCFEDITDTAQVEDFNWPDPAKYISPDECRAVIDRITDFYLKANGIFFEATRGKLDAVLIGNDFGSQNSLMLSRDLIREFVWPGTRQLVAQAKDYGLKVIHHSCGAIQELIPDLMDLGVDAIHPIQALAAGMSAEELHGKFAGKTAFCGGVDAQNLLVHGTPGEVAGRVRELAALFPTGLVISPSHEAILADIPPANIEAFFKAIHSLHSSTP